MPDKMAPEKIALLRAYGAEVVVCPSAVPPDHPESYYSVRRASPRRSRAPFILTSTTTPTTRPRTNARPAPRSGARPPGASTHFVAGIGTGGTICGIGRYLKSQNPDVQIIGADPEGSVYSGGSGRPYLVEGIGEDFWPTTYDPTRRRPVVMVSDADSFLTARRVAVEEGILVGGSTARRSGRLAARAATSAPDDVVVVLIPDSGRGYLSKLYNDEWMADHGFLRQVGTPSPSSWSARAHDSPGLIHVHPSESAREAIAIMAEFGVSQIAGGAGRATAAAAEVVGAVHERDLMQRAFHDPDLPRHGRSAR